jgi:hypothetical protein
VHDVRLLYSLGRARRSQRLSGETEVSGVTGGGALAIVTRANDPRRLPTASGPAASSPPFVGVLEDLRTLMAQLAGRMLHARGSPSLVTTQASPSEHRRRQVEELFARAGAAVDATQAGTVQRGLARVAHQDPRAALLLEQIVAQLLAPEEVACRDPAGTNSPGDPEQHHYTHGLDALCGVTNPITCYVDVITHRLLLAPALDLRDGAYADRLWQVILVYNTYMLSYIHKHTLSRTLTHEHTTHTQTLLNTHMHTHTHTHKHTRTDRGPGPLLLPARPPRRRLHAPPLPRPGGGHPAQPGALLAA